MSWNYLPELEEVFLRKDFSGILQLEQSRLSHIAALFCFSGKGICVCPSSPSGTTLRLSARTIRNAQTTSDGCGQSQKISASQEAFLARIYRLAERAKEFPDGNPDSGSRWLALSRDTTAFRISGKQPHARHARARNGPCIAGRDGVRCAMVCAGRWRSRISDPPQAPLDTGDQSRAVWEGI